MSDPKKELTQDQLALIYLALQMYHYNTTWFNHSTTANEIIVLHEFENICCKLELPPPGSRTAMRPSYMDNSFYPENEDVFNTRAWLEKETEEYEKSWGLEKSDQQELAERYGF